MMNLQDFRTRADVFPVGGVQEKFIDMTTKYNQDNYGDAVAMAKTLVESTCAYVYHTVTNKEIEEDKGHVQVTGNYTIGMYTMVRETLNLFAAQLPNFEQTEKIAITTCDLVQSIANLRNSAAAAHGGRKRSIPPSKLEALLAIEISEDLAASLLLMLHTYKYPDDSNVIGSFIDKTDAMESYVDVNDSGRYVVDSPQCNIGYNVIQSVVQSVDYEVKKLPMNQNIDAEHIKEIVTDFLPKDAKFEGMESNQMYKFYSEVHDTYYSAIFTDLNPGMILTISSFDEAIYGL
ncbi:MULTISPECIES: abortive infection family protein [Lactobacillaceae]|uniref:abortive infection family protein n=1 Tax=Lactobacillaceae TaxID=33958 RepID=UPI001CDB4714|nr:MULTISPECIES: abortive infection family protein [Lactobacillaceae]